jgi:ribose 5-phosphate isomerase RpiB
VIGGALAADLVTAFLGASYAGEERFQRRLDKVLSIEGRFAGEGSTK